MSAESSEEQLLEFLYACPVGLIECDLAGDIALMNPFAMQHLLPLAGTRDVGNLFATFEQHAPELRSIAASFAPATGRMCDGHRIFVDLGTGRSSGARKVLACTMVKLGPDRLMATLTDITDQVAQEQRLRQADTWFATLLDGVIDFAELTVTANGEIEDANASFTRQTGYYAAAVIGRKLADILDAEMPGGDLRLEEQLTIAAREGWHLQEGWQQRSNGERYWCQRLVVVRTDGLDTNLSRFSVVLREVPRRAEAVEDIRRVLTKDHLTGASNRRYFSQAMEREHTHWRNICQSLALIVLDLDHFKRINDRHGHPIGDAVLRRVTEVCTQLLPPRGVFARLGGEEFGVLLPRYDQGQATKLAEALRVAIAAIEMETPLGMLRLTASFGLATLDEADGSIDGLIALADERLYAAKDGGRNRVYRSQGLAV
ncbi:sensor domain-containing diguanylate cyclase [Sphingomonas qomolangmaensis]|uniref:diguanylate cyclase n=1 Tax=Sphingomonas qomolangmaensis TaxID=2918765 RepID=A0ABY5L8N0_9SPHN|nr:diguanylate cyclase [Sphingomonas qomolangmaensis]UUL82418.1 diguanylate cyclase [Sphingomonas qomolangmaensis]